MIKAKKVKNDEFYTLLSDIEEELKNYKDQFKGKIVFCNCDDPEYSNFWKYFYLNFKHLELKELVATHYDEEKSTYKLEYNGEKIKKTKLKQNGDFRSPESVELLKEADIVCTNPPFSKLREFILQLYKHNKKYLIIGNINAVTYKEIFPLIKDNKIWLGYKTGSFEFKVPMKFNRKNTYIKNGQKYAKFGNICWFTNLDTSKRHEELILYKEYNEKDYPKYDNYDAINVDRVKDIPKDYYKPMGVPITFINKYNPNQFKILGITSGREEFESVPTKKYTNPKQINKDGSIVSGSKANTRATLLLSKKPNKTYYTAQNADGPLKILYARIIIQRKENPDEN